MRETPGLDRFLERVPEGIRDALTPLLREREPRSSQAAKRSVERYLADLERLATTRRFVDVELARHVASRCLDLLERVVREPDGEAHRLVDAAARYFVLEHDVEEDSTSPVGFDDDLLLVSLVEEFLGS